MALRIGRRQFISEQVEQMTLGRKNVAVTRTHGGADVFRLADP
jgi:hypothetical protein